MPRRARSSLAHTPLLAFVEALRSGARGLDPYVQDACDRIERLEPTIRAFVPEPGRRDRLLAQAQELGARFTEPASRPPLFGALVGVKDIIAVDGLPTRAGSALPAEAFATPKATVVRRLRDAGALIAGKTVTTEFAYFDAGATTNPHDASRTPGGSSSGSAAAVAAGYALLALGSQTVGSVIRPAAFCGVVGFKPTYGRIPTDGVLCYSPSVDHVGLFTQDAAGVRLAASLVLDGWRPAAASEALPVLGVPVGPYLDQADADARDVFEQALRRLGDYGVTVKRSPMFDDIAEITARHRALTTAEFREQHLSRFARYGAMFRAGSAALFDAGARVPDADHRRGVEGREELRSRLHAAMDAEGIDLWVSPAAPGPAPTGLTSTGNPAMNLPWTHAGVPAITLPSGAIGQMPLGLQLAGRFGDDERLLAFAVMLESLL